MLNVNKKYICLIVMLCSFTVLIHAIWQNGWKVIPFSLSVAGLHSSSSCHQIAIDSGGNGVAVWSRSDGSNNRVQARRYLRIMDRWGTVTDLSAASQDASTPQVAMASGGNGIAVWILSDGSSKRVQARRYIKATDSWDSVIDLSEAVQDAFDPQIAIDSGGNGIAVWYQLVGSNYVVKARCYVQATDSWDSVADLSAGESSAPCPQIAIDSDGNGIAVWRGSAGSDYVVKARRYVQATDSWDSVTDLSAALPSASFPQISIDSGGNGIAVWYQLVGSDYVVKARRYVQATDSWDSVTDLSAAGADAYDPQIAMDSLGNGIAVWFQLVGSNNVVKARRYVQATDSWDLVTGLSAAGRSAFTPQVAMDSGGNGIAVWETLDGRIQARRYRQLTDSWGSVTNLSVTVQDAVGPQAAMGSNSNGIVVWISGSNPTSVVQSSHFNFNMCGCHTVGYDESITNLPMVYGEVE